MCLITKQEKPFIAEEDMIVYKKVTRCYKNGTLNLKRVISNYIGFEYTIGKLYETNIVGRKECSLASAADSIDSEYLDNLYPNNTWRTLPDCLIEYTEGFHSYSSKERMYQIFGNRCFAVECTIPKGSEWYTEPTGLIISNKIIINKIVTNE